MKPAHLCSVPTVEAPGDAMSKCSGDIQDEGPASRHKTTGEKNPQLNDNILQINVHLVLSEDTLNLK